MELLFQGIRLNTFAALQNEEGNVTFRGDLTITKINYIEERKKKTTTRRAFVNIHEQVKTPKLTRKLISKLIRLPTPFI